MKPKNESVSKSTLKDLEWFWRSFWYHFRSFLIWFLALTKSAFSITLPYEINDFGCRNCMKKSLNSKSFSIRLLDATFEAKFFKSESKVVQDLIKISSKTGSKNRCNFGRRWIAVPGEAYRQDGRPWGVGGKQLYSILFNFSINFSIV